MNEDEFFAKFSDFLQDVMPEMVLQDKGLMNKIIAIIRHEDPKQNHNMLSLLRAWCRKMAVRLQLEKDKRLRVGPVVDIQKTIGPQCQMLAEKTLAFFKVPELLPLACQTCTELLQVGGVPATQLIVSTAMSMTYVTPMKVALLELVSLADFEVDDLPLLDPIIARCFPALHKKLIKIAPEESSEEVNEVVDIVSKIERINDGTEEVDRNLLEFCDMSRVVPRVSPETLAGHPADNVRVAFYKHAVAKSISITKFTDPLIRAGLFDPKVRDMAIELVCSQFPALSSKGALSHEQIARLQCIPMKEDSAIFKEMIDVIDASDVFTVACSWLRNLYHKDEWMREYAKDILQDVFQFEHNLDITKQPPNDFFAETFFKKLREGGEIEATPMAESLFELITSCDQPDDIKKISASQLADFVLDPYKDVRSILPDLRELPFDLFPDLLHAVAIRDGGWKITDFRRLSDLIRAINDRNAVHLLPILSRIVFEPLTHIEYDGANLLRLPVFTENVYIVRGSSGFYEPKFYEPTVTFPLAPVIEQWTGVKTEEKRRPIDERFNIRLFASLVVGNKRLANDVLVQIDEEESAAAKLATSGPPHMVLYFLVLCTLSSGRPSTAAAKICRQIGEKAVPLSLTLNQAIVEFGGDCEIPEKIIDYVLEPSTRRGALSVLVTHMQFGKELPDLEFDRLADLFAEKLPVNVTRQLTALLLAKPMEDASAKMCEQRDAVTKSLGFHTAEPTKQNATLALVCAATDREAICARASALELLYDYCSENPVPAQNFAALYHINLGETLVSLQLMRLLTIPKVRAVVSGANTFVLPFLNPQGNELYVRAALNTLFEVEYGSDIAEALTRLLPVEKYTNHVLHVISTTPDSSLAYYASDIIEIICSTFDHCSLSLAMTVLNHLLLVSIVFPAKCMTSMMNLYETYLSASASSSGLHTVLHQIFACSNEAKEVAMEEGFPVMAIKDLANAEGNKDLFEAVLMTCAQFVYSFPAGQKEIFDQWGIDTLLDMFATEEASIHFFLCLACRNTEVQTLFATEIGGDSLLNFTLDAFDTARNCDVKLMYLIASLLNSEVVRRVIYRKKRIKSFFSRLTYVISKKEWALAESMMKIFVTLTFYSDGVDELLNATHVPEMLEILSENEEVWEMPLVAIFVRNLKCHTRTWKGVIDAIERNNKFLFEKLSKISPEE